MEDVVAMDLHQKLKILAGITPIRSLGMLRYMKSNVAGITIPDSLIERFDRTEDVKEEGKAFALEQIEQFRQMGLFEDSPPPADRLEQFPRWNANDASTPKLARAYLDVHCAPCHGPDGILGNRPDFSYHLPLQKMAAIGRKPRQGWIGPDESRLITPGEPALSEVYLRAAIRGDRQMPPLGTNLVDKTGLQILRNWIAQQE